MGLIAIALGSATFGLSVIYRSNVNSHASELVNEIRIAQTKQMASASKTFDVTISYDGSNYYAKTYLIEGGSSREIKSHKFSNKISIWKDTGTGYVELSTITDPIADVGEMVKTFRFSTSTGKVVSKAYGDYLIKSSISDREVEIFVVKENGRVYVK